MKVHSSHILLADDSPAICFVMATILKRMGHRVQVAASGDEAFDIFSKTQEPFDILITDHSMPGLSGLELVGRLHENGFQGRIIVMSGSLNRELETAYRAKNVDKILQKPFSMDVLSFTLEELFLRWQKESPGHA